MVVSVEGDAAGTSRGAQADRLVLVVVWIASALYLWRFVDGGWIPHDDGALAHSAERALRGELPHRDFDELYTGGLTYLHALALWLFGERLLSLRLLLLGATLAWVPAVYGIARRFVPPVVAGLATLSALAWSTPNYFASMPSWYCLFCATAGTLALLRHVDTGRRRWLVVAGLCGGLSITVKIVGLYYVAGALLFLGYREQTLAAGGEGSRHGVTRAVLVVESAAMLAFVASLVLLIRSRLQPSEVVQFVLPGAAVASVLVWNEATQGRGAFASRLRTLLRLIGPFALGVALPIALLVAPYVAAGAVSDLYRGVLVLPQKRLHGADMSLPPLLTLLAAVPYGIVVLLPKARVAGVFVVGVLALALAVSATPFAYPRLWASAQFSSIVAVVVGCVVLVRATRAGEVAAVRRQGVFCLLAMVATVGLVQFPYSAPSYFGFVAPLVILAFVAVVSVVPEASPSVHLGVLAVYLLFAVLRTNRGDVWDLGASYALPTPRVLLATARAGVRVDPAEAQEFDRVVQLIEEKRVGPFIYASPDCPELYFLTGSRNPTRRVSELLSELELSGQGLVDVLDAADVHIVVINRRPDFSPKLDAPTQAALAAHFPHAAKVRRFLVRWRDR